MKSKKLAKNITNLNLDDKTIKVLKENKINTINDLWHLTRKDLKSLGLSDHNIYQIVINLQLMGIDLNKRIY